MKFTSIFTFLGLVMMVVAGGGGGGGGGACSNPCEPGCSGCTGPTCCQRLARLMARDWSFNSFTPRSISDLFDFSEEA
ncbi:uncharacterized protein PV07_08239 [Cladophialophora immunda]|uniref:Uncharacterized protein n=1 Tax=Cladophialophora immunda TaxID=569365 RepID=A0A0D1ZKT1_9EURO|nr:uncharacterized protein PV07_08239 [Cladophialophora immunda]KIW28586.1 hypothetical protein PV07_08239 [Cladophialophora immunda]